MRRRRVASVLIDVVRVQGKSFLSIEENHGRVEGVFRQLNVATFRFALR